MNNLVVTTLHRLTNVTRGDESDRGQATAEYALLLLAAATIALLVVTWATSTGKIGQLFDSVIDSVIGRI